MMSGTKGHTRIYDNIILGNRIIFMERTVNYTTVFKNNRLKIVLLPFTVPVFPFNKFFHHINLRVERILRQYFVHNITVILFRTDIGRYSRIIRDKTFKPNLTKQGRQNIAFCFRSRRHVETYVIVIVHLKF